MTANVETNQDAAAEIAAESTPEAGSAAAAAIIAQYVGHHYRVDDYYEVGREKVREYARAVQDENPAYHEPEAATALGYSSLLAPLTFISLVGTLAQRKLFESVEHGYDLSQIMQTDQVLEFHRPIQVGDRLICDVYFDSFRQMAGTDMIVTKNIVTNQHNELLQTTYTTLVGRSAAEEASDEISNLVEEVLMYGAPLNKGPERPESTNAPHEIPDLPEPIVREHVGQSSIKFADVAVGDELPPRAVRLTRGDLVNYAGVAGDANPIHWSEELAQCIGLDTCVAHGMLTMGLAAGMITSWCGDPGVVKELSVRFVSPVYVPSDRAAEVEFSARIKSRDPETKTAVVAIAATSDGRKIFGRATATVALG